MSKFNKAKGKAIYKALVVLFKSLGGICTSDPEFSKIPYSKAISILDRSDHNWAFMTKAGPLVFRLDVDPLFLFHLTGRFSDIKRANAFATKEPSVMRNMNIVSGKFNYSGTELDSYVASISLILNKLLNK